MKNGVRSFTWSTILESADPLDAFNRELLVRSLVGIFLPLSWEIDLETNSGLMPAERELLMLRRLLIMPGVAHAVQIIWVDLCLLVLIPIGSMVLQGSYIMNAPGIL